MPPLWLPFFSSQFSSIWIAAQALRLCLYLRSQSIENNAAPVIEPLAAPTLLAESNGNAAFAVDGGVVRQYIDSLTLDDEEPVRVEHIQDSPLYRLVNDIQVKF